MGKFGGKGKGGLQQASNNSSVSGLDQLNMSDKDINVRIENSFWLTETSHFRLSWRRCCWRWNCCRQIGNIYLSKRQRGLSTEGTQYHNFLRISKRICFRQRMHLAGRCRLVRESWPFRWIVIIWLRLFDDNGEDIDETWWEVRWDKSDDKMKRRMPTTFPRRLLWQIPSRQLCLRQLLRNQRSPSPTLSSWYPDTHLAT